MRKVANRQTNNDDYISSLAEVTRVKYNLVCQRARASITLETKHDLSDVQHVHDVHSLLLHFVEELQLIIEGELFYVAQTC